MSLLIGSVLALSATACASNRNEMTQQLEKLQRDVKKLRASNVALQDRVEGLEEQGSGMGGGEEELVEKRDRPQLRVVRLTPKPEQPESWSDEPAAAAPAAKADDGPRVVVRADSEGGEVAPAGQTAKPKSPAARWRSAQRKKRGNR
jgi:hypothetical protein